MGTDEFGTVLIFNERIHSRSHFHWERIHPRFQPFTHSFRKRGHSNISVISARKHFQHRSRVFCWSWSTNCKINDIKWHQQMNRRRSFVVKFQRFRHFSYHCFTWIKKLDQLNLNISFSLLVLRINIDIDYHFRSLNCFSQLLDQWPSQHFCCFCTPVNPR